MKASGSAWTCLSSRSPRSAPPRRAGLLALAALCVASAAGAQKDESASRLVIREEGDRYVLTVPVSRLVMTVPRAGLSKGKPPGDGATGSSRYFLLEEKPHGLAASGWFEAAVEYPGLKTLWSQDTAAWKERGDPEPHAVATETIGGWEVVWYEVSVAGVASSHLRAERVQAGTWIDLHVSVTSTSPPAERRSKLRAFLESVRVFEKSQ